MRVTIDISLWARFKRIFTRKLYFKVHLSDNELRKAFKSKENLDTLCDQIAEHMYLETDKYYISQLIKK